MSTQKTFPFIGRCSKKGCKTASRVDVEGKEVKRLSYSLPGVPGSAQYSNVTVPAWGPFQLGIHCAAHKRPLHFDRIMGNFNPEHKCDSRCLGAIGPNCDCSCGGANHGLNHRH